MVSRPQINRGEQKTSEAKGTTWAKALGYAAISISRSAKGARVKMEGLGGVYHHKNKSDLMLVFWKPPSTYLEFNIQKFLPANLITDIRDAFVPIKPSFHSSPHQTEVKLLSFHVTSPAIFYALFPFSITSITQSQSLIFMLYLLIRLSFFLSCTYNKVISEFL